MLRFGLYTIVSVIMCRQIYVRVINNNTNNHYTRNNYNNNTVGMTNLTIDNWLVKYNGRRHSHRLDFFFFFSIITTVNITDFESIAPGGVHQRHLLPSPPYWI